MEYLIAIAPLLIGWGADLILGDPSRLPHPVVGFGKMISFCEHKFNKGAHRTLKGAICAVVLIAAVYLAATLCLRLLSPFIWAKMTFEAVMIFYCLAGTTLIREVDMVFKAADESLEAGRRQVGRIVGRDTSELTDQEIRAAALETLAENLSDGVIAPLFWYAVLGVPGMLAYKMVNTLDSMIGYRNERFRSFGKVAAQIDDIANYIPARLTALLMIISSLRWRAITFVWRFGNKHTSPNSGYPEAALAGILDCRFGGPHNYFGECVHKPYIGDKSRYFFYDDVIRATAINRCSEIFAILLIVILKYYTTP